MRPDLERLWTQVRVNQTALEQCSGHDFSIPMEPKRQLGQRWRCSHCGGHVDTVAKHWYERGKRHVDATEIVRHFIMTVAPTGLRERLLNLLGRWKYAA